MKRFDVKILVVSALLSSFACVATMVIQIPNGIGGYFNLGDCIVLLAGWMLSPGYGFLAAGLGSALADLFSGYVTYAPATFIIKGTMALIAFFVFKLMNKKAGKLPSYIISGILAEIVMVLGWLCWMPATADTTPERSMAVCANRISRLRWCCA